MNRSKYNFALLLMLLFSFFTLGNAQHRYDAAISNIIQNLTNSSAEWGDLNNDNLQDLVVIGQETNVFQTIMTKIYLGKQVAGNPLLEEASIALPNVTNGDISLIDCNNDGFLDIFITGVQDSNRGSIAKLFINRFSQSGNLSFKELSFPFLKVSMSASAWGDIDNDGRQDLLLTGIGTDSMPHTVLYKNNTTNPDFINFEQVQNIILPQVYNGSVSFADYNRDGLLDFALSGTQNNGEPITDVFTNEGTDAISSGDESILFSSINNTSGNIVINSTSDGAVEWGDYNLDGYLDLLVVGQLGVQVYKNNLVDEAENPFIALAPIPGVKKGSGKWGDFNNDNYLDFIYCGDAGSIIASPVTNIYEYSPQVSSFVPINDSIVSITNGDIALADVNNDNLLDVLVVGQKNSVAASELYVFDTVQFPTINEPPFPPDFFSNNVKSNSVVLNWDYTTKQPPNFLDASTFNVFVSTVPFGANIVSPASIGQNGKRLLSSIGNAGTNHFFYVNDLLPGKYYWGIQALDNSFVGSPFTLDSFEIATHTISGSNYYDFNGNGLRESDEVGIPNWKMKLKKSDNTSSTNIDTYVLTDAYGNFNFDYLPAGKYKLTEYDSSSAGWTNTEPPQGKYLIEIIDGGNVKSSGYDFGNFKNNTISGTIFADINRNGVHDENEEGISKFKIILDKIDPPAINGIDTLRSNTAGQFIFGFTNPSLINGYYRIRLYKRNGFTATAPLSGMYDSIFHNPSLPDREFNFGQLPVGVIIDTTLRDSLVWGDTTSWAGGTLPSSDDSVVVPPNFTIIIDSLPPGNDSIFALHLSTGSRLRLRGGAFRFGGNLHIDGDFIVESGKRPQMYLHGDFRLKGNFHPGKSKVIMSGNHNIVVGRDSSITESGDTTTFYDLVIQSDSLVTTQGTIAITDSGSLTIGSLLRIGSGVNFKTASPETIVVNNDDPNAVVYQPGGSIANGVVNRKIRTNSTGVYRFHGPHTSLQFSGTGIYPSRMIFNKYPDSSKSTGTFFVEKGGMINKDSNYISVTGIKNYSRWILGQTGHKAGDSTAGPLYEIDPAAENSEEKSMSQHSVNAYSIATVSLEYDETKLHSIPEDSLTILKSAVENTFRTFKATSEMATKANKMKFNVNTVSTQPNLATAVENVFKKIGKTGTTFLGVAQTNKALAKLYAWIPFKKASDLGKLYTSPHTSIKNYPLDSLRTDGKKSKKLSKAIKPDRKKYDNAAIEQGVMFKLNLIASSDSVTPYGFSSLVLDTNFTLAGRELNGLTLNQIAVYFDSVMSFYEDFGMDNPSAYQELGSYITHIIKPLNDRFYIAMSPSNYRIDTNDVIVNKNLYGVKLDGYKTAAEAGLVVQGNEKSDEPVVIQSAGYEDEFPSSFSLQQNYPNPFNPTTNIEFTIGQTSIITLKIFNILGQEVATVLNNEELPEGVHVVEFNASKFSSGVYFYRLSGASIESDGSTTKNNNVKKMLLIK